ncbi:MAG: xanthine phosphoribosyltransferase [Angelakisella sp.]|nr:xanthine phosphoribosyltransferase [Angelakisella sp.]
MKALEERILRDGKVLPGQILKVSSFLNHYLDVDFLMELGAEIARLYEGCGVTKILTVEASGIALAVAAASHMHVPVVFAKKNLTSNLFDEQLHCAKVHSYTHQKDYTIVVGKELLCAQDHILLVDDFLAVGNALCGLLEITQKAGASVSGAAIAIEKGYQNGGDTLRKQGLRVESLAIIDSMDTDHITFRS